MKDEQLKLIRETQTTLFYMREDGVIITYPSENKNIVSTAAIAIENMKAIEDLCPDHKRQMISYMNERKYSKEERRQYQETENVWLSELALIVDSPMKRMLGNFFLGVNKVDVPTKLFSSKEDAEKWLNNRKMNREKRE
jgi:hypothetical protein